MDWPEELVKLQKAISTEHGNRIFKSILSDVLDYDSHVTELTDLKIKILEIESSLPPDTSIHYLLQISQQINTLSADVTNKFDALARIEHQLESGMAQFAQKIVVIEQKVAALEQADVASDAAHAVADVAHAAASASDALEVPANDDPQNDPKNDDPQNDPKNDDPQNDPKINNPFKNPLMTAIGMYGPTGAGYHIWDKIAK